MFCHEREVTHEYLLLFDLAGLFDQELHVHSQRGCIGGVTLAALGLVVLGLSKAVVGEAHLQPVTGEVLDGGDILQKIAQAFGSKGLV